MYFVECGFFSQDARTPHAQQRPTFRHSIQNTELCFCSCTRQCWHIGCHELRRLRRRRLAAQGEQVQPPHCVRVRHFVAQPLVHDRILRPQLVVERLAVVQMQGLLDAGVAGALAGAGVTPLGPAEGVQEARRHQRVRHGRRSCGLPRSPSCR